MTLGTSGIGRARRGPPPPPRPRARRRRAEDREDFVLDPVFVESGSKARWIWVLAGLLGTSVVANLVLAGFPAKLSDWSAGLGSTQPKDHQSAAGKPRPPSSRALRSGARHINAPPSIGQSLLAAAASAATLPLGRSKTTPPGAATSVANARAIAPSRDQVARGTSKSELRRRRRSRGKRWRADHPLSQKRRLVSRQHRKRRRSARHLAIAQWAVRAKRWKTALRHARAVLRDNRRHVLAGVIVKMAQKRL